MVAALDFTKGRAAIAYRGELPWHGSGTPITDNMTLDEMIEAACLDYTVLEMPSVYNVGSIDKPVYKDVPNRKDLVRSDNHAWLSEMSGNRYDVRQPKQIVEFFRDLCDFGGFEIVTLGALYDGKRIWCQAQRKGGSSTLNKMHKPKILLAEGYDGSLATVAKFADERVVCSNTLGIALGEKGGTVKISHATKFDEKKVKAQLGAIDECFADYLEMLSKFASVKVTDDFRKRFFMKLINPKAFDNEKNWKRSKIDEEKISTAADNTIAELIRLDKPGNSPGSDILPDTLYNLLQTTTYFVDHVQRTKNDGRFASSMFGQGATRKQNAFDLCLDQVS